MVTPRLAAEDYLPAEVDEMLRCGGDAGRRERGVTEHATKTLDWPRIRRKSRLVTMIGKLLRPVRASSSRSPLAGAGFAAPTTIAVTSTAFTDGGRIPRRHAGKGIGDDVSPALRWTGVPPATAALLLLLDDVDVPMRTPLLHSVAVLAPDREGIEQGEFRPGPGVRNVPTLLSKKGYSGPRPVPGHGPHHYRFHVLALDQPVPEDATTVKTVLAAASGHVLARGTLIGTYER